VPSVTSAGCQDARVTSDRPPTGTAPAPALRKIPDLVQRSIAGDFLREVARTRVIDLAYTLSAQAFVALIPLILVVTAGFTGAGQVSAMANELIQRFGLAGAAQVAVRQLFTTPGAGSGVYWTGLLITLYSAFSLSRRVARAYTSLWDVPPLPANQMWRGLVWVLIQVAVILVLSTLRAFGRAHGVGAEILLLVVVLALWGGTEYFTQWLLTFGAVARERLVVAAALVSLGRLGVTLWSGLYLPGLLSRQADQFGPIGVVFSLFSWIFASALVLLVATLLAAVLTSRPPRTWLSPAAPVPPVAPATS
jgi:membrane protein